MIKIGKLAILGAMLAVTSTANAAGQSNRAPTDDAGFYTLVDRNTEQYRDFIKERNRNSIAIQAPGYIHRILFMPIPGGCMYYRGDQMSPMPAPCPEPNPE